MAEFFQLLIKWASQGDVLPTQYPWDGSSFRAEPSIVPGFVSAFMASGCLAVHRMEPKG